MKAWKQFLWIIAALGAAALSGCSAEEKAPPVTLTLAKSQTSRGFVATWEFKRPARAMAFARNGGFRSARWHGMNGVRVEGRGAKEILIAGIAATKFQVFIPADDSRVQGDYPFIIPFSDSGLVMHTGYLVASPTQCFSECTEEEASFHDTSPSETLLTATGSDGEHIVSGNGAVSGVFEEGDIGDGSFLYFGRQVPVHASGVRILADRHTPVWIRKEVLKTLPQVTDFATQRLGYRLAAEPLVFITDNSESSSAFPDATLGGVTGNQMLLNFSGSDWSTETAHLDENLHQLVAHESFHLWNGSMFHSASGPGGEWLHEGAAEEFSFLAMRDLGYVSVDRSRQIEEETLNRCVLGSVRIGVAKGHGIEARNPYACGALVHSILNDALHLQGSSLYELWHKLFFRASQSAGEYSEADFFALAANAGVGADLEGVVHGETRALEAQDAGVETYYINLYKAVGRDVVADDEAWPTWYEQFAAEKVLTRAMAADCGSGGVVVSKAHGQVRLGASRRCRVLHEDVDVDYIGPHKLWEDGVGGYDYVQETCQNAATFKVRAVRDNSRTSMRCPSIPARPKYLRFL